MSDSHKGAPWQPAGSKAGQYVAIWRHLAENKPRRGRKRTRKSIEKRLVTIEERLATTDPLARLHLVQTSRPN